MKVNHKRFLPFAWILTSVAVFLLCFDSCLTNETNCFHAGDYMLVCMIFLTFPCGLLYPLVLSMIFNSINVYDPVAYFLLWLGAFVVGYLQWFVLLPRLFHGDEITTLGIAQSGVVNEKKKSRRELSKRRRKRNRQPRLTDYAVAQWDETGRTPLERVISNR